MKDDMREITVALAGQPNSGKSTIFNMLTGARQHVANYPGVTVEKKWGRFKTTDRDIVLVDLPGTYSLTSYTQEERIARDYLLNEKPRTIVTVVDAANLERSLYLVFQLQEMELPMVLCLNMMDTARSRGMEIDVKALENILGIPVAATVGNKGHGKKELLEAINRASSHESGSGNRPMYDVGLESYLGLLEDRLRAAGFSSRGLPGRWLAIKLMENDEIARRRIREYAENPEAAEDILSYVDSSRLEFMDTSGKSPEKTIAAGRYRNASDVLNRVVQGYDGARRTITDRIDSVALHPILAPIILLAILFIFYQTTMVYGTRLADWFFPYLHHAKVFIGGLFPASNDLIRDGLLQSMIVNGLVGGIVAILYYVPIFMVLFGFIAILEDSGYMPRVAFIMDRVLRYFGLHGQSTLPLILGGVLVGGCAVPGVMATRAMKDEKAKLVTILIMPLMNCLAKIPFYVLIVGLFFVAYQGLVLFCISLFSFSIALIMAKIFSSYMVKGESAPFVMELPAYHLPTIDGILRRAVERVWLFVKKIITIVAIVMICVWFFITFPGIGFEREAHYDYLLADEKVKLFQKIPESNPYSHFLADNNLNGLIGFKERLKEAQRSAAGDDEAIAEINGRFSKDSPKMFMIANNGVGVDGETDRDAKKVSLALKRFERDIRKIRRQRIKEVINTSWAGQIGKALEPVSSLAGFNWRINIAIISSFAAKESLVGTLGAIYSAQEGPSQGALAESIRKTETSWTIWSAIAILVFVALFPPCLATLIMIRHETQSTGWMIFATVYPIITGFILASFVYQIGPFLFS